MTDTDPTPLTERRSPARLVVFAVLMVLVVVGVVLISIGVTTRAVNAFGLTGEPQRVQREREDVMAQAEQFMLRVNTYGPDLLEGTEMPRYRTQVTEVITPKFATDFEKNVPAAEATVAQAGLGRTCTVYGTGVSSMDDDSAVVLVAGAYVNSFPSTPGASDRVDSPPSPFRVEVDLVRVDGEWLVDDFTPVTGLDDQEPQVGGSTEVPDLDPSGAPSSEPSSEPAEPSSGGTP